MTVVAPFDVRREGWIPAQWARAVGEHPDDDLPQIGLFGLRNLLVDAHRIEDLALPVPPAAAGLWRILYAITARVTGLDQDASLEFQGDWLDRGAFVPDKIDAYFDAYPDRFNLFDAYRPWLQDPRLAVECPKASGVNKLLFDRPAGNTQVWFGHHTDAEPVAVPAAEAAWYLIAQLYYGASGRCSSRTMRGESYANSYAGPLRGAMSFHPRGRNLFESLILGVPAAPHQDDIPDRCPWEAPDLPDPLALPAPVTWPGGLLTGQARHAILLVPSGEGVVDGYVTWGTRHPAPLQRDPYVVRRQNAEGGWYQLPADGSRSLWRDVDALLGGTSTSVQRPEIMRTLAALEVDGRVRAYGFDQDGQAKDRQWFTAVTPPILAWLNERDPGTASGVSGLTRAAETFGGKLGAVLRLAWQEMSNVKDRQGPWVLTAQAFYWAEAERLFWDLVYAQRFDGAGSAFAALGHRAIDHAADSPVATARQVRAVQTAHRLLNRPATTKGARR